ncbi:hypothetical protein ACWGA9_12090 [Streptomyces sp. NPDC054950]
MPTLLKRGPVTVRVHVYGTAPDSLAAGAVLVRKLAADHGTDRARIVSLHRGHRHGAASQLLQTEAGGPSDRLCVRARG